MSRVNPEAASTGLLLWGGELRQISTEVNPEVNLKRKEHSRQRNRHEESDNKRQIVLKENL